MIKITNNDIGKNMNIWCAPCALVRKRMAWCQGLRTVRIITTKATTMILIKIIMYIARSVGIGVQTDAAVPGAAHRRPKTLGSLQQLLLRLQQAVRLPGPAALRRLEGRPQAPGQGRRRRRRKLRLRGGEQRR